MRRALIILVYSITLQDLESVDHEENTCLELDAFSTLQWSNAYLTLTRKDTLNAEAAENANVLASQIMPYALDVAAHRNNLRARMVPKLVHHIYKYDISHGPWPNRIWQLSFLAWKKFFPEPEYRHEFWSDERTSSFIQKECSMFSAVFAEIRSDIAKSDFSRYCILWRLGGIYADLDYMPLRNFYNDLKPGMVSLLQSPYPGESFQNSLMASPPGNVYWKHLMQLVPYTLQAHDVLLVAGPHLLDILPLTRNASWINTLSCNAFQRITHFKRTSLHRTWLKGCQSLSPSDVDDETLKGIHWGTISYSEAGSPVHLNSGQADQIWNEFWEYVRRPPWTNGVGPELEQKGLRHALLMIDKEADHS